MFEAKQHLRLTIDEKGSVSNSSRHSRVPFTPSITCTPCTPSSIAEDTFSSRLEYILAPQLDTHLHENSHLSLKSLSSLPSIHSIANPCLGHSNYSSQSLHNLTAHHSPSNTSSSNTIQLYLSETALTPNVTETAPVTVPTKLILNENPLSRKSNSEPKPVKMCKDKHKSVEDEIEKKSSVTYNESKEDEKSNEHEHDASHNEESDEDEAYDFDSEEIYLIQNGYKRGKKIATTLQGFVYEIERIQTGMKFVVKQTDKHLHEDGVTIQKGKKYKVKEDILKERDILRHVTNQQAPSYMVRYIDFFESDRYYYLVMEHGGTDLFQFIVEAHKHIQNGALSIKEWRKFLKYIFWQMCVVLLWLHNTAHATHLDVSLENILVQNARFIENGNGQLSISSNIQIKFCDFGLAQFHNLQSGYMTTKYCGKTNYKSPQVYSKKCAFDGRKADVYALGVVLFCMAVGAPPYHTPNKQDSCYTDFISKGRIAQLLYQWRRHHYCTERMLSLIKCMLECDEKKRFVMDDVVTHPWLRIYYTRYNSMIKQDLL